MELKDVKVILKRIQVNYPSFVNDSYVQSEWYRELKDYDIEDVMKKLEEHMRSSEYGGTIPKLYFLTKYLKTAKEKQKVEHLKLQCKFCGEFISEEKFDEHFERCLDIDFIVRKRKALFQKETNAEEIKRYKILSKDIFDSKYLEFLDKIYNLVSKEEKTIIENIINPPHVDKIEEL